VICPFFNYKGTKNKGGEQIKNADILGQNAENIGKINLVVSIIFIWSV